MKFYLAPLEGITRFTYRNAIHRHFGKGVDKYFTPFFAPHTKRTMNNKEMTDVLVQNNEGIYLVPQILTNSAEDFLNFETDMRNMFGYEEVNINLGCPSGTVFCKKRGAGFLSDTEALDDFLYEIYSQKKGKVSVKTRLGVSSVEEFEEILEIYNKYPMEELIIHPRVREEFYKGTPHWDIFARALDKSKNDLSYSGDIYSVEDYERLLKYMQRESSSSHKLKSVMLGRGMVADPSLIRQLTGGIKMTMEELKNFHDDFLQELIPIMPGPVPVMYKMKELWIYMINNFQTEENKKLLKKIQKTKSIAEYTAVVNSIFSQCSE